MGTSAAGTVLVVKGAASQTANLTEWQNSSGTVLASISAAGAATLPTGTTINGILFDSTARLFGIETLQNNGATIHIRCGSGDGLKALAGGGVTIDNSASPDSVPTLQLNVRGTQLAPLFYAAGFTINGTGTFVTFGHQTSASYPALKRNATALECRLADDSDFAPLAAGLGTFAGIALPAAGDGLAIKEGSNATMGVATLVAGTVTVSTTKVTANSRIFLSVETLGTVTIATAVAVTGRSAGTSFDITSSDVLDTSDIAWLIVEPV